MADRGTKPPKTVWVIRHLIYDSGENYIWGIFAARETAVASCHEFGRIKNDPDAFVSHWEDGDAYFYYDGGRLVVQRYTVEIHPRKP